MIFPSLLIQVVVKFILHKRGKTPRCTPEPGIQFKFFSLKGKVFPTELPMFLKINLGINNYMLYRPHLPIRAGSQSAKRKVVSLGF